MSYTPGAIRIDMVNASGAKIGGGPLATVQQLEFSQELDRIGGISFPVPATDPRTQYIGAGVRYRVYHTTLGYLGEFIHRNLTIEPGEKPILSVTADDLLRELAQKNALFNRQFKNQYLGVITSNLIALVSGWSDGAIANVGYTTVEFQGESVLNAIVSLAKGGGTHFRLGSSTRTLDFGDFGDDSGIRCVGVDTPGPEIEYANELAIIDSISVLEEGTIINRLIPLGAGQGQARLTLRWTNTTDPAYPVKTGTNPDGSSYYYIEDTASQSSYGLVESPYPRNDIRPLAHSTGDLQYAADALYNAALAYLKTSKDPQTSYRLKIRKLRRRVRPGQTVRVFYRGVVLYNGAPYKYVDVDEDMVVLAINTRYTAGGEIKTTLDVSAAGIRPASDAGVLSQMHRDIEVVRGHIQPSESPNKIGPYERELSPGFDVDFPVNIGDEVLFLNHIFLRFSTRPLRATTIGAASGGGNTHHHTITHDHEIYVQDDSGAGSFPQVHLSTIAPAEHFVYNSGGGGGTKKIKTQTISTTTSDSKTIPDHTHPPVYGIYDDTHYPQNIHLYINGTDRSTALGGPWAPSDAALATVEVDVRQYLHDASGNLLRQEHKFVFKAVGGTNNQGTLYVEGDMLQTTQAIAVS